MSVAQGYGAPESDDKLQDKEQKTRTKEDIQKDSRTAQIQTETTDMSLKLKEKEVVNVYTCTKVQSEEDKCAEHSEQAVGKKCKHDEGGKEMVDEVRMNGLATEILHALQPDTTDSTGSAYIPFYQDEGPSYTRNEFRRLAMKYQQCKWPDNTSSESSESVDIENSDASSYVSTWSNTTVVLIETETQL